MKFTKYFPAVLCCSLFLISSCTGKNSALTQDAHSKVAGETQEVSRGQRKTLPEKQNPQSMLMSESPIKPNNIDEYLFREDCVYVDLRKSESFYAEGHIAGFTNVPFYDYIAGFPGNTESLFQMTAKKGSYLGDAGSFVSNYNEAESIVRDMFDANKTVIAISTAGVESCYFLNLLFQLGYNPEKLYNVGSFTNGMGSDIAYMTYRDAKYLVAGLELVNTQIEYKWLIE